MQRKVDDARNPNLFRVWVVHNYKGPNYVAAMQNLRKAGYTRQIWAVGDDGNRPQYGGIKVADAVATVNYLADRGLNFCLFNPKGNSTAVIEAVNYP